VSIYCSEEPKYKKKPGQGAIPIQKRGEQEEGISAIEKKLLTRAELIVGGKGGLVVRIGK